MHRQLTAPLIKKSLPIGRVGWTILAVACAAAIYSVAIALERDASC
jgi:hypothetical protein